MKSSSAYGKIGRLLRTLLDDEDDNDGDHAAPSSIHGDSDPHQPWLEDFHSYLRSKDQLQENMSIVQWWGLNAARYPIWASLALDYLSIMATSVSSERAFSSAGITISKRRNRLKADIVEALQCVKCFIRRDLLFREDPSVLSEVDTGSSKPASADSEEPEATNGEVSWDTMIEESEPGISGLDEVDDSDDVAITELD